MSTSAIVLLILTGGIHLIGIGLFLLWMAAGHPLSREQFREWIQAQAFLKRWHRPKL